MKDIAASIVIENERLHSFLLFRWNNLQLYLLLVPLATQTGLCQTLSEAIDRFFDEEALI